MSSYEVVSFYSLVPAPPAFVIPVFSYMTSNSSFVQELDGEGNIIKFLSINTDEFYPVNDFPKRENFQIGDGGIYAFWEKNGTVLYGKQKELKVVLQQIDNKSLPVFLAVEKSMLVGDSKDLINAVARAKNLLIKPSSSSSYGSRVKGRMKVLRDREAAVKGQKVSDDASPSIDAILAELEIEKSRLRWLEIWKKGWSAFPRDTRLVEMAKWKLSTTGLEELELELIGLVLGWNNRENEFDIVLWWLANRKPTWPGWLAIWSRVRRNADYSGEFILQALSADLKGFVSAGGHWTWLRVWDLLRTEELVSFDELISLAGKAETYMYRDHAIERMILPIYISRPDVHWAAASIREWLSNISGTSLWATVMYEVGEKILGVDEFTSQSVRWLRSYGRGLTIWLKLYNKIKDSIDKTEAFNIAVSWLSEARKDLYDWPVVFADVSMSVGTSRRNNLKSLARQWSEAQSGRRSDKLIESFL